MRASSCRAARFASRQIKFKIAMRDRPVISLADVQQDEARGLRGIFGIASVLAGVDTAEPHCIPRTLRRSPRATAGISQLQNASRTCWLGEFALMPRSRAMTASSHSPAEVSQDGASCHSPVLLTGMK